MERTKRPLFHQDGDSRKGARRTAGRFLAAVILAGLTVGACALAHRFPQLFFPWFRRFSARVMSTLSQLVSPVKIAVWDFMLLLLIVLFVGSIVRMIRKRKRFLRWLSSVLLIASILFAWFVGTWGLNYYAPPLAESIGLDVGLYTVDELEATTKYWLDEAERLSGEVPRNEDGTLAAQDFYELATVAGLAADHLPDLGCTVASAPVKKLWLYGPVLVRTDAIGIFMAFTGESNVAPQCAKEDMPFTMVHEIAHRSGIASEQEANFCAFVACESLNDVRFRYSGAFSAFLYCYNALYKADPERAKTLFPDGYAPLVRLDIRTKSAYYKQFEGKAEEIGNRINDAYLKSFSQTGVRSYGEVVDYLIAYYYASAPSAD